MLTKQMVLSLPGHGIPSECLVGYVSLVSYELRVVQKYGVMSLRSCALGQEVPTGHCQSDLSAGGINPRVRHYISLCRLYQQP